MHRKVMLGQQDRQARAMSLPKALRLSTAKVANKMLGMAMAVIGARQSLSSGPNLPEHVPDDHLLLLFDGARGRIAAAMLEPALVGGLMQQQTMGNVTPQTEGEGRRLTATDAAICAPFVEELLNRAGELPEEASERDLISGYTFGAHVEDARLLLLSLDAAEYEVIQLTLDIAAGKRQGTLTLLLPVAEEVCDHSGDTEDDAAAQAAPKVGLDKVVLRLDVELRIALSTLTLSLGKVQGLAVGDIFDLDVRAFDQATVVTREGRSIARGTLGQIDGTRALQLEHQSKAQRSPRRRASDRSALDLPKVSGDGTGTQEHLHDAAPALADMRDLEDGFADLPDLPDMSDLPGFEEEDELQTLQAGIR